MFEAVFNALTTIINPLGGHSLPLLLRSRVLVVGFGDNRELLKSHPKGQGSHPAQNLDLHRIPTTVETLQA